MSACCDGKVSLILAHGKSRTPLGEAQVANGGFLHFRSALTLPGPGETLIVQKHSGAPKPLQWKVRSIGIPRKSKNGAGYCHDVVLEPA